MARDPIKMMEALIGQKLEGLEIDTNDGVVTLSFEYGFIEFAGEDFDAYIELKDTN